MNKTAAGILGTVVGFFVFGAAGYSLGLLYLTWYGPEFCCELEGIYPVAIGTLIGALLGAATGALAGVAFVRRSPLRLVRLLMLLCIGVAILWLGSLVVGHQSAENTALIVVFVGVGLVIPTLIWVTDVWEKPDTSI
jgi:hypothetical protein